MSEYIDREALLDDITAAENHGGMGAVVAETLKRYVKRQPTVDVVKAVRCKDCINGEIDDPDFPNQSYCHAGCGWNEANFSCSYGKRKKEIYHES